MSDESIDKGASSSSNPAEYLAHRALPPGLDPPVSHSQTVSTISAEAEQAGATAQRGAWSSNALDDLRAAYDEHLEAAVPYERKLEVLIGLLYEFDEWLERDVEMTSNRRGELHRRLEGLERFRRAFERLKHSLPAALGAPYQIVFEQKFCKLYYPLVRRGEKKFDPSKDSPPDERPSARQKSLPPLKTELDISQLDRFSRSVEKWEKIRVRAPNNEECLATAATLQQELLEFLIESMDVRYVSATREIREKLWR